MTNSTLGRKWFLYQWALIGVILLGALLRLPTLDRQSIWFDEAVTIAFSSAGWTNLLWALLVDGVHPPLFYMLTKLMLPLTGTTQFAVRFLSTVPALLTIPVIYRLGQAMFNRRVGLLAALLLAVNPLHIWLSQEARMYGIFLLLVTASMFFFWRAMQTNKTRYWVGLFLVNALVFNVHYFSLLVPAIQFVVILSRLRQFVPQFRRWVVTQFLAGLALLPWLIAMASREYQSFGIGSLQSPSLLDLPLTLWNFAGGYSTYFLTPLAGLVVVVFALALLNALRWEHRKLRFAQIMLIWWLFLPVGVIWLVSQRRSFYADKYFSLVIPGLLLLLAFGAVRIRRSLWRGLMVAGLILVTGYGLVNTSYDPAFYRDNWRELVAYVTRHEQPGDVVLLYTPHIKLPFDYYYRGDIPRQPISQVLEYLPLEPLTAGHQRAWVVYPYSRHPNHDPKRPLRPDGGWHEDADRNPRLVEWLDDHTDDIIDYHHFRGMELWLVALNQNTAASEE